MHEQVGCSFEWLLLLAFPNGGSTALAKLLLTADGTAALTSNAEGQWLVPAMCEPRARWDPEKAIDYDFVRACWVSAARQAVRPSATHQNSLLIIEKSPPNMCRYKAIVEMLSCMKTNVVVMTRDPYATCASWHIRHGPEQVERDWGWVGQRPADEGAYFEALADIWIRRAQHLDAARGDAAHWIRYEDVSEHLSLVVESTGSNDAAAQNDGLGCRNYREGLPTTAGLQHECGPYFDTYGETKIGHLHGSRPTFRTRSPFRLRRSSSITKLGHLRVFNVTAT